MIAKHQRRGASWWRSGAGHRMLRSGPALAPDQSLTVTALSCSVAGVWVLRVVGEVDLLTVNRLREQLHHHLRSDCRGLVLDFTGVSFLAACAIGVLVEITERTHADGIALRLVAHHRLVLRALEVSQADQQISQVSTVAEAIAQCAA